MVLLTVSGFWVAHRNLKTLLIEQAHHFVKSLVLFLWMPRKVSHIFVLKYDAMGHRKNEPLTINLQMVIC
jgi:hypothetical protein